jgi:hypothetical protein
MAHDLDKEGETLGTVSDQMKNKNSNKNRPNNDKPKRPLSAYNLFFQMERQKLSETETNGATASGKGGRHKKPKMPFGGLARYVADKWKNIDPETLAYYQGLAAKEQKRYMSDLVSWKIDEAHQRHGTFDDVATTKQKREAGIAFTAPRHDVDQPPMPESSTTMNINLQGWHLAPTLIYDNCLRAFVPIDILSPYGFGACFPSQMMAFSDPLNVQQQPPGTTGTSNDEQAHSSFPTASAGATQEPFCQFPLQPPQPPPPPPPRFQSRDPYSSVPRRAHYEHSTYPTNTAVSQHENLVRYKAETVTHNARSRPTRDEVLRQNASSFHKYWGGEGSRDALPKMMRTTTPRHLPPPAVQFNPRDFEPLPVTFMESTRSSRHHQFRPQAIRQPNLFEYEEQMSLEPSPRGPPGGYVLDNDVEDYLLSHLGTDS